MQCASSSALLVVAATILAGCRSEGPAAPVELSLARGGGHLSAPSGLSATPTKADRIALAWQDNSSNETGFEVHRSTTGAEGAYALLAAVGPDVRHHEDIGLAVKTLYCYRVRARGTAGKKVVVSEYSDASCATIPTIGITVTIVVTVVTTGGDVDADGYRVVLTRGDMIETVITVPANGTVTIPDLPPHNYFLTLTGDAPNCHLMSPATVGVPSSGPTNVDFTLACMADIPMAYVSRAEGNAEIYRIGSADWTIPTRLTSHPAEDVEPSWSPDGARIAFVSDRDGNDEIYVMDADGSNVVRLTDHPAADRSPAWSPAGDRLAFVTERDGNPEIYLMNADGSGPINLTNESGDDADPAWSPDGRTIAYSRFDTGHIMSADGSPIAQWFPGRYPAWSPDGNLLAYSEQICGEAGSEVLCWRGIGITDRWQWLTHDYLGQWIDPVFAPSQRKIAFADAEAELIITLRMDGTDFQLAVRGFQPAWRR